MAEQIADLVVNLDADTVNFQKQMGRVERQLLESSRKADVSTERMRRLAESQAAAISTVAGKTEQATTQLQTKQAAAADGMKGKWAETSLAVDEAHQRVIELSRRLADNQQQARVTGEAQDRLTASFFRQIDGIKGMETGLQQLRTVQDQVRKARAAGNITQGDYLALVTETTAKSREMAQAERSAARDAERAELQRQRFLKSLKDQVTAQSLSREELLRVKADQLGAGSAAEIYIRKLNSTGEATHQLGLKSAAARREIGILLGEAARGNFGALRGSGITLANRAGWIDQLMTLRGLGIAGVIGGIGAAVYGLGKAWYEGSQEAVEFNKQLILTGSYAGKTAGELQSMARMLTTAGVTQYDAADALAKVVGSGNFSGSALLMIADTAAKMKASVGQSVDETVNQFKRLQDNPVQAVTELDKSMHFLTATQLEQITTLADQGRSTEAAAIAMDSYAVAMRQRSGEIKENLGTLESAWKWLGDAASSAWDKMLNIGRETSVKDKIRDIQQQLVEFQVNPASKGIYFNETGKTADDLKADLSRLMEQDYQDSVSPAREKADRDNETRKKRQFQADQTLKQQYETAEEKHQRELAKIRNSYASQSIKDDAIRRENERYAKEKSRQTPKKPKYQALAGDRAEEGAQAELLALQAQLKLLQDHKGLNDTISQQRQDLQTAQAKFFVLEATASKRQLTQQEKSLLASKDSVLAQKEKLAAVGDEVAQQQRLNKLQDASTKYVTQMAEKQQALVNSAGLGDRAAQRESNFAQLRQGWLNQGGGLNDDGYRKQLQAAEDYYAAEDQLRGDWMAGSSSAWSNYQDQAADAAGMTKSLFTGAFSGMENALASFVTTGKAGFKEFTVSILADLAKIALRMAMSQGLQSLFGAFGAGAGNNPGAVPMFANAKGGVYSSPSLSAYSGQVVNKPTYFAFAKGAGVMGEAGAEGIFPLKRGRDGKLGVAAIGGPQQGNAAPNVYITIEGGGNANTQADPGWEEFGKTMGSIAAQESQKVINRNLKPGQPIWKAIKGG